MDLTTLRKMSWRNVVLYGLMLLILAGGLGWLGLRSIGILTMERHVGYFGPALSADGQSVWYFQRNASGLALGMGWEHFSPPARVFLRKDELFLRRYDRQTGQVETLHHWPTTPLRGQKLHHYRGRILGLLGSRIRVKNKQQVDYAARMALLRVPSSQIWSLSGTWTEKNSTRPEWVATDTSLAGLSEPIVAGPLEVMAVRGEEGFPTAIVLLDHDQREVEVLLHNETFDRLYPNGPQFTVLLEFSRKAEVDRLAEMHQTYEELKAKYRAVETNEGAALLAAGREMARLGWWPTPATIIAQEVKEFPAGLRVFTIDPQELRVGLFPNIQQAIAHPGTPAPHRSGYVRHRDFTTSEELNAFLATAPEAYGLRISNHRWLIRITPHKPANR